MLFGLTKYSRTEWVLCTALQAIIKMYEDHGKVMLTEKTKPDVIKFKKELVKKKHPQLSENTPRSSFPLGKIRERIEF
jgi:hypothetical protein